MADVFVSYSREDKPRAAKLVRLLEDNGWDVFWDQETRTGTLWPKVLEQELEAARCLLALWTRTSIDSRWVRIEAYEALQTDKLLPLLLDDVRPPLEFRQTQTLDLIGWDGDRDDSRIVHLLLDLKALMKAPQANVRPINLVVETVSKPLPLPQTTSATQAETVRSGKPRDVRRTMLGVGLAAAAAVGIAVAWSVAGPDHKPAAEVTRLPATPVPTAGATVATVPPAAPPETPDAVQPSAGPSTSPKPPATKPTTQTSAAASTSAPAVVKSGAAQRCVEIAEKFQQTGQLTAAERDFLRSKECRQ